MKNWKLLLSINILLLGLLTALVIKEDYPKRLFQKTVSVSLEDRDDFKSNWSYNHETKLYNVYKKKGNIVMLGNSITYRCNWNELLDRDDIINRGVQADITLGFLNRLGSVYNTQPKFCFIMGGVNDITRGIKSQVVVKNTSRLIDSLRQKDIKPIIQSVLYVAENFTNSKKINQNIKTTNLQLKLLCDKRGEVFLDLNKVLSNKNFLQKENSIDGIHLTAKAYEKWGNALLTLIDNLEKEKRGVTKITNNGNE